MKIVNNSKNTIYIEDIDYHLQYADGEPEEIQPDTLKKSRCLRNLILTDLIQIAEYNPSENIENSLNYLKNKHINKPPETKLPNLPDKNIEADICSEGIEVKIHGLFYDASGYGKVNRNLAIQLHKMGVKVCVAPNNSQNQLNEEELRPIAELSKTKVSKNHILIDSIIPSFSEVSSGKYRILYTTIESYTLPKQFVDCCQNYQEIWVTSPFAEQILKRNVPQKPIYVIPPGVDTSLYTETGPKFDFRPNIKDFLFISVFGWNKRKGYDVLLKAYFDEFSEKDNVSLLLASRYQGGQSLAQRNKIKQDIEEIMQLFPNKDLPHLVRYSKIVPEVDMPKLYRSANCFILCTRGESSCLPPLEASLCGLPVIMTNVSGQQMYLRHTNSYRIECKDFMHVPKGFFGLHYWDGQKFPDLDTKEVHQQIKYYMRHVVDNYADAQKQNKNMQELIHNHFTWTHTGNLALQRLKEIHQTLKQE